MAEMERQWQRWQPRSDKTDHAAEARDGARRPEGDGVVVVIVDLQRCDDDEPTQSANDFLVFVGPWEGGGG